MTRAVFLDAQGTLLEFEPPWVHLRETVPAEITDEQLVSAVRAEMAYYKGHAHEGRDEASLADLRAHCATIVSEELGVEVSLQQMVDAVRFRPYPDTAPALSELRMRGLKLIVVSNWDCSLPEVLERCGLLDLVDDVLTSADSGASKPDPAIFLLALERARCEPGEALHVGDMAEEDIAGARAAGIRALLIDRDGGGNISSLGEIVEALDHG